MTYKNKTTFSFAAFFLGVSLAAITSVARADGFNSVPGVDTVPFGANGATVLDLFSDGDATNRVGINVGTATPRATLDVAGGIRPGDSIPGAAPIKSGNACTGVAPGTMAYDATDDQIVYCDHTSVWKSTFGAGSCPLTCNEFNGQISGCSGAADAGFAAGATVMHAQVPTGSHYFYSWVAGGNCPSGDQIKTIDYMCVNGSWIEAGGWCTW